MEKPTWARAEQTIRDVTQEPWSWGNGDPPPCDIIWALESSQVNNFTVAMATHHSRCQKVPEIPTGIALVAQLLNQSGKKASYILERSSLEISQKPPAFWLLKSLLSCIFILVCAPVCAVAEIRKACPGWLTVFRVSHCVHCGESTSCQSAGFSLRHVTVAAVLWSIRTMEASLCGTTGQSLILKQFRLILVNSVLFSPTGIRYLFTGGVW